MLYTADTAPRLRRVDKVTDSGRSAKDKAGKLISTLYSRILWLQRGQPCAARFRMAPSLAHRARQDKRSTYLTATIAQVSFRRYLVQYCGQRFNIQQDMNCKGWLITSLSLASVTKACKGRRGASEASSIRNTAVNCSKCRVS